MKKCSYCLLVRTPNSFNQLNLNPFQLYKIKIRLTFDLDGVAKIVITFNQAVDDLIEMCQLYQLNGLYYYRTLIDEAFHDQVLLQSKEIALLTISTE